MIKVESTSIVRSAQLAPELLRLRSHAALVRALLDDLDRVVPFAGGGRESLLGGQLVEELARLGSRVLECAAALADAEDGSCRFDSNRAAPSGPRLRSGVFERGGK